MRKIELKAKEFAKRYIKNKFDGTATALELYNTNKRNATNIANQNLNKPVFQNAILEEMEKQNLNDELVAGRMKQILIQKKHLPSAVAMIDQYHKLKGYYSPEKNININMDIPRDEIELGKAMLDIEREIRSIEGTEENASE